MWEGSFNRGTTVTDNYSVCHIECECGKVKHITFLYTDVDECEMDPCHEFAMCTNTPGNFTCECLDDYRGNGFVCHCTYFSLSQSMVDTKYSSTCIQ